MIIEAHKLHLKFSLNIELLWKSHLNVHKLKKVKLRFSFFSNTSILLKNWAFVNGSYVNVTFENKHIQVLSWI